jgi:SET domain
MGDQIGIDGEEVSKKARYMRAYRSDPARADDRKRKNREHQAAFKKRVAAFSAIGKAALETDTISNVLNVASLTQREEIFSALNDAGIGVTDSLNKADYNETYVYNVSKGKYEELSNFHQCEDCKHTCSKIGICEERSCLCFNTNTICAHSYCCPATPFLRPTEIFDIKPQSGRGLGAFAKKNYPANFFLCEFTGVNVTESEAGKLVKGNSGPVYVMAIPRAVKKARGAATTLYIDGSKGNVARYINHSCEPNVSFNTWVSPFDGLPRIAVYTTKPIRAGTALGVDYAWSRCGLAKITCKCGSKTCKGFI